MRLIKNFLHNINDIVLAVIIVALAVGIIYWRMQIILDYPKELADQQADYRQEEVIDGTEDNEAGADDAGSAEESPEETGGGADEADTGDEEADDKQ